MEALLSHSPSQQAAAQEKVDTYLATVVLALNPNFFLLTAPGLSGSGTSGGVPDLGGSIYSKTQVSLPVENCFSELLVLISSFFTFIFLVL